MSSEIMTVLNYIEKEKGIDKEILISAVESALVSAAKKVVGNKFEEVTVKLDRETGDIKMFSQGKPIESAEFGRIAAQTAKQIIIQKIREAERDVIFADFQGKIGTIINGGVHRFEKGNIIVDLGKAEAILPLREQVEKEQYKQGDRIRAYILDVKKTPRGPQIILSRTHPGIVKRLFEMEVPEIYEGIVEIRCVSREAGDRSKIAVYSKDEKIDPVGACVGMRGSRVKNIVRELHGEKIDIVRFSDDIKDYITASLSPAKVDSMKVNKENRKAEVTVENDQLSLAIGKRGQNVRLAAKLTGWDIDIKSKAAPQVQVEEKLEIKEAKIKEEPETKIDLRELDGVGPKIALALEKAGITSIEDILKTGTDGLTKVEGIGKKTAQKILNSAKKLEA